MAFEYNGVVYRDLEPQVRYDAEQIQLLKQADATINENLQTVNESLQTINTELDGKLTKPTNPSAESAVTMLADGTVGTKLLSEIGGGGGKLYLHQVEIYFEYNDMNASVKLDNIYNTSNTPLTTRELLRPYFKSTSIGCRGEDNISPNSEGNIYIEQASVTGMVKVFLIGDLSGAGTVEMLDNEFILGNIYDSVTEL